MLWHTWFYDVFSQGGFDIVIANPPYIGEKGHKEIFQPVKLDAYLGKFYLGKMDYFYFFFHFAFNVLKNSGIGTFITTNYYLTALGAKKLRQDIKERMVINILLNLGELKLFENAPGQHNMISSFAKGCNGNKCHVIDVHKKGSLNPRMFETILSSIDKDTSYDIVEQENLYDGDECYIRLHNDNGDSPLASILQKISQGNEVLGNIAEVNAGIMGGCDNITNHNLEYADEEYVIKNDIRKGDGVFVLDRNNSRDSLKISVLEKSNLCKDFYKNSDIKKYCTNTSTSKIIIFSSSDTPTDVQTNIKSILQIYKPILVRIREINKENTDYWHQLRRGTAHPHIFTCNKIVCHQRSKLNTFGYNECDWYASADVYYITNPKGGYQIKYLLGLLNSKLIYIWLYNKGKRKGESLELYQKPLSEIPIFKAEVQDQNDVIDIVENIINSKDNTISDDYNSNVEKLDMIIYKLYNLSESEIKYIESFYHSKQ
jgi:adenine-specific DNA-methyltransferase